MVTAVMPNWLSNGCEMDGNSVKVMVGDSSLKVKLQSIHSTSPGRARAQCYEALTKLAWG